MPRDGFAPVTFKRVAPDGPTAKATPWDTDEGEKEQDAVVQEDQAPPLSGDATRLAQTTIALRDLLDEETEFLRQRRTKQARDLHGRKNRLMTEYRALVGQLKVNDRTLGAEDSPQRVYIRKLTDEMREALKQHARVVMRLKAVSEGLIKSIGEEVAKKNRPIANYGRSARITAPKTVAPTSLALNQMI